MNTNFDAAISVAGEDAWIAKDIRSLLKEAGHTVYFYGDFADLAQGYLRRNLHKIYSESAVNILLWSQHYQGKLDDPNSIICQEFYYLLDRHLAPDRADSLLIVCVDREPVTDLLADILFHDLRGVGLVGICDFTLKRIKTQRLKTDGFLHPDGLEGIRTRCIPCRFRIVDMFSMDRLGRWRELGDIEIRFTDFDPGPVSVPYLIPSGAVPAFLRHSNRLRHDAACLAVKKAVGEAFAAAHLTEELTGVRFMHDNKGMEYPHAYCGEYDQALLARWDGAAEVITCASSAVIGRAPTGCRGRQSHSI